MTNEELNKKSADDKQQEEMASESAAEIEKAMKDFEAAKVRERKAEEQKEKQ